MTISSVSGQGTCVGKVPPSHVHLCNETANLTSTTGYPITPPEGWWMCSFGLTPCVSLTVLNQSHDYCVVVQLVPRLIYHDSETFPDEWQGKHRWKKERVSLTLAVMISLGVAAWVGTGATALIQQPYYYQSLRDAIDLDIQVLEDSVSKLQESLTSLSEVVIQNRRGLDFLFLQRGGLCAALKEECCF